MRVLLGFAAIAFLAASAHGFTCSGVVRSVALNPASGLLQVDAGHGMHYLCKFQAAENGVEPEVCMAWYTMFLLAQSSGREVSQTYDDEAGTSCATLGNWEVPQPLPHYVALSED